MLNLSLGAIPTSSTVLNPLDQAVETAWQAGITVVVSAGNAGPFNGTILSPGDDPLGDHRRRPRRQRIDRPDRRDRDDVQQRRPDQPRRVVQARPGDLGPLGREPPGARLDHRHGVPDGEDRQVQLRRLGNVVQRGDHERRRGPRHPERRARATGTRQDTGPTPDQVKAQLLGTTSAGPVGNPMVDGHGALNAYAAATKPGLKLTQTAPTVATNMGDTVDLQQTWNGSSWNGSSWNGSTWNGSTWNGLERLFVERVVLERAQLERLVVERLELERLVLERLELERLVLERLVLERVVERLVVERLELERLVVERLELERVVVERVVWNGSSWNGSSWNGSSWNWLQLGSWN